jgi:hypothetical protein
MKVTTNKYGEIRIRWQYNLTNGDRDVTKAFLEQKVNPKEDAVLIKEVSVMRKPSEKYDKEKARAFALGKLLKESFSEVIFVKNANQTKEPRLIRTTEDLKDRTAIWDAYKNRSTK